MNRKWQKKSNFILLVATFMLGVCGIVSYVYKDTQGAQRYMELQGKYLADQVDEKMQAAATDMDWLAEEISAMVDSPSQIEDKEVRKRISDRVSHLLEHILKSTDLGETVYLRYSLEMLNRENDGLFFTRDNYDIIQQPLTDLNAFEKDDLEHVGWYYMLLENGAAMWFDPYTNENINKDIISYEVPIYVKGTFVGLVGIDLDLDELKEFVNKMTVYETGEVFLRDRSGQVINGEESGKENLLCSSQKLVNGMWLLAYAPAKEVFQDKIIDFGKVVLVIYVILVVAHLTLTLWSRRKRDSLDSDFRSGEKGRKYQRNALMLVSVSVLIFLVGFAMVRSGFFAEKQREIQANNHYDQVLHVVAIEDMAPYSYIKGDKTRGYDIELINELANRIGYNVDIKLMTYAEALAAMEEDRADVMMSYNSYLNKNNNDILCSAVEATDSVVVYGKTPIENVVDLVDKKIGKIEGTIETDIYGLSDRAISYGNDAELFQALEEGVCDYAICRKTVGQALVESKGYEDLQQVYDMLNVNVVLGVSDENVALLRDLNDALANMKSDGTIQSLQESWLEEYNDDNSPWKVVEDYKLMYILLGAVVLLSLVGYFVLFYIDRREELTKMSEIDALTGILNRGGGERRISQLIANGKQGMFCLLDVDKFKEVNDNCGHTTGDEVLVKLAACLRHCFRDRDIVMRLGGDEFAVFAVGITSQREGWIVLDRLFGAIEEMKIPELQNRDISVSVGATFVKDSTDSFSKIYQEADKGTYESKNELGNQVTFSETISQ
ncbi:MAG: diguanylate cyclase [Eubacterium sp.]|nr:diguanylate cyclase [Eubacterium sp.]